MPRLLRPSGRDSWCWWQKEMHLRPLSSLAPEDLPTAMAREMAQHSSGPGRRRGRPTLTPTPTLTQPPGRRESSPNPAPHRLGRIRSRHGITEAIRSNSVSLLINLYSMCSQSQVRSGYTAPRMCGPPLRISTGSCTVPSTEDTCRATLAGRE